MKKRLPIFLTFWDVFKQSFFQVFNTLGLAVTTSLIWFVIHIPIFVLIPISIILLLRIMASPDLNNAANIIINNLAIYTIWSGLVTTPISTAFYGILQARKENLLTIKDYFRIAKQHYWSSVKVGFIFALIVSLLFLNIVNSFLGNKFILTMFSIVSIYMLFFLLLMQFYFIPLIYNKNSLIDIAKKSFYLVGDNFGFTFLSIIMLLILMVLCFVSFLPAVFAFGAFLIFYVDNGFEAIYKKYHPDEEQTEDEEGKEDLIGENDNG